MANSPKPDNNTLQRRQPQAKRFFFVVVLVLIVITLIIVATIWLAVQPKVLIYSIEHSSINGYNFSSTGRLNATYHCLLRSKNPNKRVSFYFDRINVDATYFANPVFHGSLGPFYQPVTNVTDLEVDVAANTTAIHGKAAEDMRAEGASGSLKMEVRIEAKIRMKIGVFKVHRTVTAHCGPYDVPFSESKGFKRITCDTEIYY